MMSSLIAVSLLLPAAVPPARAESPRSPSPFAPSLPQLTDQEEEKLDLIVHRFILQDIGKLQGREAEKAVAEFKSLGPEAIFALTRGLNRSANIESSCPALLIARKMATQVRATNDLELLEFLRENIGAGVTKSKHIGVLRELRLLCNMRKNAVGQQLATLRVNNPSATRTLQACSIDELMQRAQATRGEPLRPILRELEKRDGDRVLDALVTVANSREKDKRQLAEESLESYLSKQSHNYLKEKLKDERAHVRAGTAKVVGDKKLRLGAELIGLLTDDAAEVRRAARQSLVKLSGGKDFGPDNDDSLGRRDEAARKWRVWWKEQNGP